MKPSKRTLDVTRVLAGGMSFKDYYTNAGTCPFCRSRGCNFTVGDFFIENGDQRAGRDIQCEDCGKKWRDMYHLVAIEELPENHEIRTDS